jgi:Tfp pilus assembly protein FimT
MIEMMIVVTMIAIISALTLPQIDYTQFNLDGGMRTMRMALQKGQSLAVAGQHNVLVGIDLVGKHKICVLEDADNNLAYTTGEHWTNYALQDGVQFGMPPSTWSGAPVATGMVTATTVTFTCNPANSTTYTGIVFHGDGAASSNAQFYITSKRGKSTDWRGVDLAQSTARATPERMTSTGTIQWEPAGF